MVFPSGAPTALAYCGRKPAVVHVSPETMMRKHGVDKNSIRKAM